MQTINTDEEENLFLDNTDKNVSPICIYTAIVSYDWTHCTLEDLICLYLFIRIW